MRLPIALAAMILFVPAQIALAQSRADGSLAFSMGSSSDRYDGDEVRAGGRITYGPTFSVTGTVRNGSPMGFIGELSWGSGPTHNTNEGLDDNGKARRVTFTGGPRISLRRNTTPFAQFLMGYARETFIASFCSGGCPSVRPGGFFAEPGIGIDLGAQDARVGFRVLAAEAFRPSRRVFRFSAGLILFFPKD